MNYHYMKTDKIIVDDKFRERFFINLIQDNVNTMQILKLKFDEN